MPQPDTTPRPRTRARTTALAVAIALTGLLVLGAVTDATTWRADMEEVAALASGGAPPLAAPVSQGNALCLDVCRGVEVEYRVRSTAPETIEAVRRRLVAAGFDDVVADCSENVWCSVHGTRDGLAVRASQYEEDAPYDVDERRTLTVHVGEAD